MEPAVRILGPLEVTVGERVVALGAGRERAILGILLLNVGEVVSVERLIDGVWGEARPSSAKHMVHEYVSKLRGAMTEVSSISTRPPGYMLELADDTLDVRRFAQLTAAARTAARARRHDEALTSYDQALELWRGDVLADVALEGQASIAAASLDRERRLVGEERVDCALALGQHQELIPELERRVEEAPLNERSRAQLMLAQYRAGRQLEALERYREGRALLIEHAGVEPGPELRELEGAILRHDPALDLAQPAPGNQVAGVTANRRWPRAAAAGVALAAAIGALVFVLDRSGSSSALAQIDANSAGVIDPGTNRLVDEVHVGTGPGRIAAGFGSLWVVNDFDNTVSRIDSASGNIQTIPVDGDPTAIAVGAGFVWVACTGTRTVDRIDPQVNKRTQRIPVGNGPSGIAISPGTVWVTNRLDDTVTEIDSKSGRILRAHLNAGQSPSDIAYGVGGLWITNESTATVTRLEPRTGGLQPIHVGNGPEAVAIGSGSVWVANTIDGTVSRIDPRNDTVSSVITVGAGPSSVLATEGAVWVTDSYGGRIVRVDPATNHIVHTIDVASGPQGLATIGGRIWLTAREAPATSGGGTLRLLDTLVPDSLDEGVGYEFTAWSVFSVIGDGLVGFKRVGGLDGGTLVPDLATSLPEPTDGGRTYTFRLRRGIRYSNGDPVRASDVRRALERDLRLNRRDVTFFGDLVAGELVDADTCSKSRCDLSRGVATDDRAGTVVLHLSRPDPELFYKLALPFAYPVPRAVSVTRVYRLGVPGTGPYMIRSYKHRRLVLARNPRFTEWSGEAQPSGYPARIVLTYDADPSAPDRQLTAVEQGTADLTRGPPASRLHEISTRFAAQEHVFPLKGTVGIFLNTRLPPFNNLKARQAFNYAIDRKAAVAALGGVEEAAVTCQSVPVGMSGYRPDCPYTRSRTANGVWTGPDLSRARELVAASGTKGQRVILWTSTRTAQKEVGEVAVAALKLLGYRAKLKVIDHLKYFGVVFDSRTHAQAGFFGWFTDYPATSSALLPLTCRAFQPASENSVNASELCDRNLEQAIDRAVLAQAPDARISSDAAWAAVDRLATRLAPWASLANPRAIVVVSRRVRNVQSNPQWGVLIDQIRLR